jgi:hypothetical protein
MGPRKPRRCELFIWKNLICIDKSDLVKKTYPDREMAGEFADDVGNNPHPKLQRHCCETRNVERKSSFQENFLFIL